MSRWPPDYLLTPSQRWAKRFFQWFVWPAFWVTTVALIAFFAARLIHG